MGGLAVDLAGLLSVRFIRWFIGRLAGGLAERLIINAFVTKSRLWFTTLVLNDTLVVSNKAQSAQGKRCLSGVVEA